MVDISGEPLHTVRSCSDGYFCTFVKAYATDCFGWISWCGSRNLPTTVNSGSRKKPVKCTAHNSCLIVHWTMLPLQCFFIQHYSVLSGWSRPRYFQYRTPGSYIRAVVAISRPPALISSHWILLAIFRNSFLYIKILNGVWNSMAVIVWWICRGVIMWGITLISEK